MSSAEIARAGIHRLVGALDREGGEGDAATILQELKEKKFIHELHALMLALACGRMIVDAGRRSKALDFLYAGLLPDAVFSFALGRDDGGPLVSFMLNKRKNNLRAAGTISKPSSWRDLLSPPYCPGPGEWARFHYNAAEASRPYRRFWTH